jgi:hypothetical protein
MALFLVLLWLLGLVKTLEYFDEGTPAWERTGDDLAIVWIWSIITGLLVLAMLYNATPAGKAALARDEAQRHFDAEERERSLAASAKRRAEAERERALADYRRTAELQALVDEQRAARRSVRSQLAADRSIAWRVYQRDGFACVQCGTDGTHAGNDLTVDHITPVSLGGTNDLWNLQTLCRRCNSRKGARI